MAGTLHTSSIKLEQALLERLRALAELRAETPHAIMRQAIAEFVEREEARQRFNRETLEAWIEYKETGESANAEDVFAWMASWGSDKELPVPTCRS